MDDSLLEYYAACADSDSDTDSDGAGDTRGDVSPWRAASGDSPLRGRPRSPKNRSLRPPPSLLQPTLHASKTRKDDANREGHAAEASVWREARAAQRTSSARLVADLLATPLDHRLPQGPTSRPTSVSTLSGSADAAAGAASPDFQTAADVAEAEQRADVALRFALLMDVLCALRLDPTRYYHAVTLTDATPSTSAAASGDGNRHRGSVVYRLTPVIAETCAQRGWHAFRVCLERLLDLASVVATLQAQLTDFHAVVRAISGCVDVRDVIGAACADGAVHRSSRNRNTNVDCRRSSTNGHYSFAVDARIALGSAAFAALRRLGVFVRGLLRGFRNWLLDLQTYLAHRMQEIERAHGFAGSVATTTAAAVAAAAAAPAPCTPKARRVETTTGAAAGAATGVELDGNSTADFLSPAIPSSSMLELMAVIDHNAASLRRLLVILESSACFAGLVRWAAAHGIGPGATGNSTSANTATPPLHSHADARANSSTANSDAAPALTAEDFADAVAAQGTILLDHLIMRLSALQDTSHMDLYRVHVVLLLHCAWPYLQLATATVCGLVCNVDPDRWRAQLPRLLRSSFSHTRPKSGGVSDHLPTDLLSLMLNCIGYDADDRSHRTGGRSLLLEGDDPFSATVSARRFILRSLAVTARKQSHRKSRRRGSATPLETATAAASAKQTSATTAEASGKSSLTHAPSRAQDMTVEEILAGLVRDADTMEGSEWGRLFVLPYAQRVWQAEERPRLTGDEAASTSTSTYSSTIAALSVTERGDGTHHSLATLLPAAVPLSFAVGDRDVSGQTAQRLREAKQRAYEEWPPCAAGRAQAEEHGDDDDDDGADAGGVKDTQKMEGHGRGQRSNAAHCGALWCLRISDLDAPPDVELVDRLALQRQAHSLLRHHHRSSTSSSSGSRQNQNRHRRDAMRSEGDLWIPTTIPATRWIAAALLVPTAMVIRQLHERRLARLLQPSCENCSGATRRDVTVMDAPQEGGGEPDGDGDAQPAGHTTAATMTGTTMPLVSLPRAPASFSLSHAVRLLVGVALCRDRLRLVDGFLEPLLKEPRWWVRRRAGSNVIYRRATGGCDDRSSSDEGTASTLVSTLFAAALRGKRHGNLVELRVLPQGESPPASSSAPTDGGHDDDGTLLAREVLDVFASFQLRFAFPDELALVLLPTELCMAIRPSSGGRSRWEDSVERTYTTCFWERRRGRLMNGETTFGPTSSSPMSRYPSSGVAFEDVWSYFFGYVCTLHAARISLREHRKALHTRDTQDDQLLSVLGTLPAATTASEHDPSRRASTVDRRSHGSVSKAAQSVALSRRAPLAVVARGHGSALYALGFVTDALLDFTLREASTVIYQLEHLLARAASCGSVMQLCRSLDTLVLQLYVVCFPARPPTLQSTAAIASVAAVAPAAIGSEVRAAIHTTLALALDPGQLPVRLLSTRSRNAVEALIALVAGLDDASLLKSRLRPLLAVLTFNGFYGWAGQPNFQFR